MDGWSVGGCLINIFKRFMQTTCDMGVVVHGPGYITMGAAKKSQPSGHLYDLESERRTLKVGAQFLMDGWSVGGCLTKI